MEFPKGFDFGLKDKDGKPLCVGDIFQFKREHKSGTFTTWTNKVVWIEGLFAFGCVMPGEEGEAFNDTFAYFEQDEWEKYTTLKDDVIPFITKIDEGEII